MDLGSFAELRSALATKTRVMTRNATLIPAPTRRIVPLAGGRVGESASRHQPRLCPLCQGPMGRQEDACWRCGAPVRPERFSGGHGSDARHTRRPRHSEELSASVRRRRATRVHDYGVRDGVRSPSSVSLPRGSATHRAGTLESAGHRANASLSRAEDVARSQVAIRGVAPGSSVRR